MDNLNNLPFRRIPFLRALIASSRMISFSGLISRAIWKYGSCCTTCGNAGDRNDLRQPCRTCPEIVPIAGISGRLWDITKPLFQIARLINPEKEIILEEAIFAIAGEKSAEKRNTTEGKIVEIIHDFNQENGLSELPEWSIQTSYITNKFNEGRPTDRQVPASWIGTKLKSLSLNRRRVNGCSKYIITQSEYKTLLLQYGLSEKQKLISIRLEEAATGLLPEKIQPSQEVEQVVAGSSRLPEVGSIQREIFEERAALMEHEGGLSKEEAEKKAAQDQGIPF